jgi:23S rRNA pseudouridine2604 synthase
MNVNLDVPTGTWRDLTAKEMKEINRLISGSAKTQEVK